MRLIAEVESLSSLPGINPPRQGHASTSDSRPVPNSMGVNELSRAINVELTQQQVRRSQWLQALVGNACRGCASLLHL